MFAPLGLFKSVACPEGPHCRQLNCIFLHSETENEEQKPEAPGLDVAKDAVRESEPASKRRKLAHDDHHTGQPEQKTKLTRHDAKPTAPRDINDLPSARRKVSPPPPSKTQETAKEDAKQKLPADPAVSASAAAAAGATAKSVPDAMPGSTRRKALPKQYLNPRMLKKAPATHAVRTSILLKLHGAMKALNEKAAKLRSPERPSLVLSPDELIVMALDEEQKTAIDNPRVYGNVIKLRIVQLQKMTLEVWEKEVTAYLNSRYYKIKPPPTTKPTPKAQRFTTDLKEDEEIIIARMLRTELKGKEQFGYITRVPTDTEIAEARKGMEAAQGWEKCERCAGRFQVFPGRREDGSLASGGRCTYHPGKIVRPARKATDHITGQAEAYYPCCNETLGTSAGCTKAEHHAFKVSDPKRLAAVLQFEETPTREKPTTEPRKPVTFDCEMAYTTLGLELVRLTALSWPQGELLLDVLVKPIGEILDLNSRFSGVFPEHFATAVPYGTIPKTAITATAAAADLENGEIKPSSPMQVVDSPAVARTLLFEFLDPETPLIGHAIDNDLNAVRIIHPTIIDTVLLYPHPRGLPLRYGLKHLAKLYLDRDIQMGGNRGHDSKEDALATGDLVRFKVAEKAKILKRAGWTMKAGGVL
ncbi:RNA exonuclease 3 [Talaromyces atroroseus]|uniref:RNA exonuclease 3 n=1 Tax=Talaromyces atroroseus TaxID=1441469 RepID=A0A225ALF6_TALAT|nr:RNA exonuclease 3 [Talaromyces atroroseus]OKL62372.1 RNA exonuclease 3 [Talaromyces atroroseus]